MASSRSSRRPSTPSLPARVGIKDIARHLGVSIGTVDRALHDKPGINPATRARVLAVADALGYRPNLAARRLKAGTRFRVVVQLPTEIALFWDSLREGIREAAAPFEPTLHVDFASYPRLGEGDVRLFREALRTGAHGLIVAPGDPAALRPWIRKAARAGVAVVCVVTDAPETERLTSVSADPFTVGAMAGELLARAVPAGGSVAFFTGWLATQDHGDKLRGFESALALADRNLRVAAVVEAHDDERVGYRRALSVLRSRPELAGLYVSTVNSLPVLRAAERLGRLDRLTIVTTDFFPALVPWIRRGAVAATIYQRPVAQGRAALRAMCARLLDHTVPPSRIKVMPHVVMRSNLDLVLERLRVDVESIEAASPLGDPAPRDR